MYGCVCVWRTEGVRRTGEEVKITVRYFPSKPHWQQRKVMLSFVQHVHLSATSTNEVLLHDRMQF